MTCLSPANAPARAAASRSVGSTAPNRASSVRGQPAGVVSSVVIRLRLYLPGERSDPCRGIGFGDVPLRLAIDLDQGRRSTGRVGRDLLDPDVAVRRDLAN